MKKILLFIDNLGAGGAQRQLVGLAVLLKQKGYQVKVCYYQDVPFYAQMLDEGRVPHELIEGSDNHKKRIPVVTKYFKKENPDWVIAYQETPSLVACMAKILGGKFKLLVSERNTTQHIGLRERIRFFLYHWADAIVPNSYAQEEFMASHYTWMKSKIKTIVNFVDLNRFRPVSHKRNGIPIIAIAASVCRRKNVMNFISAIELLSKRGRNFRVEWYGLVSEKNEENQGFQKECVDAVKGYGLKDVFEFYDKTPNVDELYQRADYLCLPSFFEGTPNTICEGMASGLPIICSNVCDNPIYVHEGENGFLFDPNSPESMANTLEKALCIDEDTYRESCKNSREIAEVDFSENAFVDNYIQLINQND